MNRHYHTHYKIQFALEEKQHYTSQYIIIKICYHLHTKAKIEYLTKIIIAIIIVFELLYINIK